MVAEKRSAFIPWGRRITGQGAYRRQRNSNSPRRTCSGQETGPRTVPAGHRAGTEPILPSRPEKIVQRNTWTVKADMRLQATMSSANGRNLLPSGVLSAPALRVLFESAAFSRSGGRSSSESGGQAGNAATRAVRPILAHRIVRHFRVGIVVRDSAQGVRDRRREMRKGAASGQGLVKFGCAHHNGEQRSLTWRVVLDPAPTTRGRAPLVPLCASKGRR